MTTMTIQKGLVSQEAIKELVRAMQEQNINHIFPSKATGNHALSNEAIDELLIDEEGNVMLAVKGSDSVILPQFISVCNAK
ncbi:hypothetical protein AB3N02_22290 [Priestia aryabhattai]|uniref:hypothetical protein n=1 Tax=Priestia aryabhattai TaxID=412384 RepID=UPI00399FB45E